MLASEYLSFKQTLQEKNVIFSYSGFVSEGVLFALGDALRQKMAIDDTDMSTTKRVFSVFVEQVQNIIRYSAERVCGEAGRPELTSGMVTVGNENGRFFVVCANVMDIGDMNRLRERLEHLRGLGPEEIKAYYKEKLRAAPEEGSKGGSIGLIEIARRASEPIQFDFINLDDTKAFFCLKAYI